MAGQRFRVEAPDGAVYEIEAPDGATDEQIAQMAQQAAGNNFGAAINRGPEAPTQQQLAERPTSFLQGFGEGVLDVVNHAADWVDEIPGMKSVNQWGAENLGTAPSVEAAVENQQQRFDAQPVQGSGLGRFAGAVVGSAPLAMLPGGALTQGAAGGALLSDERDALGITKDAVLGAAGGYVGQKALGGLAAVAKPVVDDGLRTLIDAGVRVTPGQWGRSAGTKFGERLARTEDRAVSTPFVGDEIVAGRNRSMTDFARSTINRAVEPIGLSLPDNIPPGRAAVRWAGDKLSAAYDAVVPNIAARGDDQLVDDLVEVQRMASMLPKGRQKQFDAVRTDLARFWSDGETLAGQNFKAVQQRLNDRISRLSKSMDADQQDLADVYGGLQTALNELAARQNPAQAEALRAIDRGWKGLVQVERASANSKASINPAGYSQAVRMTSDTVRNRGYSRGQALNQDLADAASDILPSEIADSGTAGRAAQSNLIYLGLGALQAPLYRGAQAALPVMTRQGLTSDPLAKLLGYGARAAPVVAPALESQLRR